MKHADCHVLFPEQGRQGPDPALKPLRDWIDRLLPVRYPRPGTKICPACAEWMRAVGTNKIGRFGCPLCHGDGRVPVAQLKAFETGSQELVLDSNGFMKPRFGECRYPGMHRLVHVGGHVRCPGCDALCIAPDGLPGAEAGTLVRIV